MAETNPKRTLIIGAGPCGLLAAALLLQRGEGYHVTLVDRGEDLGAVQDLTTKRSWTIGLAEKGIEAFKKVPGLYEQYVMQVGTPISSTSFFFGKKKFRATEQGIPPKLKKLGVKLPRNYVVDRNAIVAACSKFLKETHGSKPNFEVHWNTQVLYVDHKHKRVLVRKPSTSQEGDDDSKEEKYIGYDCLLGCDGIGSTVRSTMQYLHQDFLFDRSDTFSKFKSVHIRRPKEIEDNCIAVLIESLPNMAMIGLPQSNDVFNLTIGHFKNNRIAEELLSRDVSVVARYMKENLHAFALEDYDDFAKQWVQQDWSTTGQLHCSSYHSEKLSAVIMGDAAHATSPALALGMNTALCDAAALDRLLDTHKDDWTKVLPAFSAERVKEGYALTELSFHLYALSPGLQLRYFLWDGIRDFLWRRFPTWIKPSAMTQCFIGYELSEVYKFATRTNRIQKPRQSNHRIQREHFETSVGLAA